jgi:glutamate synthase (NADPH) small chain
MICPKCRRPTEDAEVYICCGDAALQWRCGDCGKVSEGFAFPYGLCPYCGGGLSVLDDRRIEDARGVEAIRTAFEIELGGRAFYARAAVEAGEAPLRELFGRFAEMEGEHLDTLSRRYHADVPDRSDGFRLDRAAVFAGLDNRPDDPGTLFRVAIAFEERAVRFFSERGESTPEGSEERQLYKELAAEEQEHVALLSTEYERWKQGKAGVL